jgi:hypothetical protein
MTVLQCEFRSGLRPARERQSRSHPHHRPRRVPHRLHILPAIQKRHDPARTALQPLVAPRMGALVCCPAHCLIAETQDHGHLYQIAASVVMEKILDGDLVVRGRRRNPNRLDYEVIPPTDWHSSWLHFLRDPIALWKMHVVPRGGVEINPDGTMRASDNTAAHRTSLLDYDSLIVDAYQFETLWPKTDALADKKRRKFLRQAWWRGLNKDERRRLS